MEQGLKLTPGKVLLVCDFCGCEFGRWRSELAKRESDRVYCRKACQGADPVWRARMREKRVARAEALREELLAARGACGSPTCRDSLCSVPAGGCHRPGCEEPAAIARQTSAAQRWVGGYPSLYCSSRCSGLATHTSGHPVDRVAEAFRSYKEAGGYVDIDEAARRLDRAEPTIERHARRLGLGSRYRGFGTGEGAWLFTEAEVQMLRGAIRTSPSGVVHRDPRRRADWHMRRHKSTKMYGRLGGPAGVEAGKAKGGRPALLTPEQQQRILRLNREGWSTRAIAEELLGNRGLHGRIHRFLHR